MNDEHWIITLYERYVQLFGEPIEQPITSESHECVHPASPMNNKDGPAP